MLKTLGAHAVGMSTVFEVIAARHCGLDVLALSIISNLAAGLGNANPLSHEEVLAVGKEASQAVSKLIYGVLLKLSSASA